VCQSPRFRCRGMGASCARAGETRCARGVACGSRDRRAGWLIFQSMVV
jgi:hypothetical protein